MKISNTKLSMSKLVRHTIVLGPKEEALLRHLNKELHLSKSAAIRYAIAQWEYTRHLKAIRQAYQDFPETRPERRESASLAKSAVKTFSRERW